MRKLLLFSILISVLGCHYGSHKEDYIKVVIPDDLFLSSKYCDSYQELMKSKLKILVYIDSLACGKCWANSVAGWYDIANYVESKDTLVSLIMVFAPKYDEIQLWKDLTEYDPLIYPLFVDTGYSMMKGNVFLSTKGSFMGLLNERNEIILQEHPRSSEETWNRYKNIIESYE